MIEEASGLETEMASSNFFAVYSRVNSSIEQMFIDFLLLMDVKYPEEKNVKDLRLINMSKVLMALTGVTLGMSLL